MVKYKYARLPDGKIISIYQVDKSLGERFSFKCISCERELIAKKGSKNVHHFAHKHLGECSPETYLHKLGKDKFKDIYEQCLREKKPFFIEYPSEINCNAFPSIPIVCESIIKTRKFNLTKYFKEIEIEARFDKYRPDILLRNPDNGVVMFIEIVVTHKSTIEKRDSGIRIIEIYLSDEDDLKLIESKYLEKISSNIEYVNFKNRPEFKNNCEGRCNKQFDVFFLFKNGKAILKKITKTDFQKLLNSGNVHSYYMSSKVYGRDASDFKCYLSIAHLEEKPVKNCYLCRYHADNNSQGNRTDDWDKPIFCKFLKRKHASNYAASCQYYRSDQNYVSEYLSSSLDDLHHFYNELDVYQSL